MVDVCIIGGGLAGSTCAIRLAGEGFNTVLLEKNPDPHHKLCGEFLSGEVVSLLASTDVVRDLDTAGAVDIKRVEIYSPKGKKLTSTLPGRPIGVSRYVLDKMLRDSAIRKGATLVPEEVVDIRREYDQWVIRDRTDRVIRSRLVIGAYGRRSKLDRRLGRMNSGEASPWLAFKAHVRSGLEDDVLRLFSFPGGYCGISTVDGGISNMCWITNKETFTKSGATAESMLDGVMASNPAFRDILESLEIVGDRFYSASQLTFDFKEPVVDGILMAGDAAGMIAPVCGDGMAMAIDSANRAGRNASSFLGGSMTRVEMEHAYFDEVRSEYQTRMSLGKYLHQGITRPLIANPAISVLARSGTLTSALIRYTRG